MARSNDPGAHCCLAGTTEGTTELREDRLEHQQSTCSAWVPALERRPIPPRGGTNCQVCHTPDYGQDCSPVCRAKCKEIAHPALLHIALATGKHVGYVRHDSPLQG